MHFPTRKFYVITLVNVVHCSWSPFESTLQQPEMKSCYTIQWSLTYSCSLSIVSWGSLLCPVPTVMTIDKSDNMKNCFIRPENIVKQVWEIIALSGQYHFASFHLPGHSLPETVVWQIELSRADPCRLFLTAASQLRAVTITRSCVAVTIVETDDANCFYCDGLTFVSTDAVVAVHKSIDYLYSWWKPAQ